MHLVCWAEVNFKYMEFPRLKNSYNDQTANDILKSYITDT